MRAVASIREPPPRSNEAVKLPSPRLEKQYRDSGHSQHEAGAERVPHQDVEPGLGHNNGR